MTGTAEHEAEFLDSGASPSMARHEAGLLGYYTPGLLRMRLWLTRWQWWVAERFGVLPAADRTDRKYVRWSIDPIERDPAGLRERVLAATGDEAPVGAYKAAVRLAARLGLEVTAGDVEELVKRGAIMPLGTWRHHLVYDVRALDGLDREPVAEVVAGRPRRERERTLLRRDQCERLMGLRRADFAHVVRRGLLQAADHERVWVAAARRSLDVPMYRASEVDDLLAGPIDWDSVRARAAIPGARSLLVGDEPAPTREQAAERQAMDLLRARHQAEFDALLDEQMHGGSQ